MRESRVWQWLEDNRPNWLEIERFETTLPAGTGDCFLMDTRTVPAITGWLELKYCAADERDFIRGYIPKLRPTQPLFLRRMAARGIPSGILLRAGSQFILWRSDGTHEWSNLVRGANSRGIATKVWPSFPNVEAVWDALNPSML